MKKYSYFVALIESSNHIKFVTDINNATKVARWEAGKPAMQFTKSAAENLVFGLTANCFPRRHSASAQLPRIRQP